jgi:hypothetical protein
MWLRSFLIPMTVCVLSGSLWASVKTEGRLPGDPGISATSATTNQLASTFNLQDYGSVGDGVTDDGPALQRALDAVANAGGGIVYVPAGRYAIITPVTKDFSNISDAHITIQGVESSTPINVDGAGKDLTAGLDLTSEFVIKIGEAERALSLSGLGGLLIKDLVFIGTLERESDALVTISLSDIREAKIQHCEFYGLASFVRNGAIVLASRSQLNITETAFLGCTVGSGYNGAVVQNTSWKNISITESVFTDYGLRPGFFGKTTWGAVYSWVGIGNAAAVDNLSPRREAFIEHVFLDEGHIFGVASRPDLYPAAGSAPIDLIYISRLRMNVNNLGFSGLYLFRANRVFVRESYFGWSHNAASALSIVNVGEAVLDGVECVAAANTIYADAATNKLTVINSSYEHLSSLAQTTQVINTATPDEDPAQYVAQQFKDKLGREPDSAGHDYWTNQLLMCSGAEQCVDERKVALASYLGSTPSSIFSITGQVTDVEGAGMPGVAVALSGSQSVTTHTNSNGDYTFTDLPTSGHYVIVPTKNHYTSNSAFKTFTTPSDDQTADFTTVLKTYVISGIITAGGNPLSGATVTLSGGQTQTATTNNLGAYSFTVNAGGSYTLTATKTHYTFRSPVRTTSDLSADMTFNFSAALNRHRISGRILKPSGEALAGATVALSGSQTEATTSSTDGAYSFTVNAGGNYTLTATKTHYSFTSPVRTTSDLSADMTFNFSAALNQHRISGRILKPSGEALAGATVVLSGSQTEATTSGNDGAYSFTVNAGANYTLTASKSNYALSPQSQTFNDLGADQTADFGVTPLLLASANSTRAVALEPVTFLAEPFSPTRSLFYGADNRTRVMLFATELGLLPGEGAAAVTAEAEDATHTRYPLTVEYVGSVPGFALMTAIIVRLNDNLGDVGDVLVRVTAHGLRSNRVRIGIGHLGGGPPDDPQGLRP